MPSDPNHYVIIGQVVGVFGVKGWVKVRSDTEPRDNILKYTPWYLRQQDSWVPHRVAASQRHSKGLVVQFEGITDRDSAALFVGCDIAVARTQLPSPATDEYYWTDLIGLKVHNTHGEDLGTVSQLLETGAHDVLVVKEDGLEHLIPFVKGYYVLKVDLEAGSIEVDWERDYSTGD